MTTPDELSLDTYDYTKLKQLAERVAARMDEIREQAAQAAPELKARFQQECLRHGMTLEELCNGSKPRKRRANSKRDSD